MKLLSLFIDSRLCFMVMLYIVSGPMFTWLKNIVLGSRSASLTFLIIMTLLNN